MNYFLNYTMLILDFEYSILAYGQTGSGKTYTMMGDVETEDFRGMIPRSIKVL